MNQENRRPVISPAFSNRRETWLFIASLIFMLALPYLLSVVHAPSRESVYKSVRTSYLTPFFHQEIFTKSEAVDILFLGHSSAWVGIDVPWIERKLSEELKRPVHALMLASNFEGEDLIYTVLSDFFAHRYAKLVVIAAPVYKKSVPHPFMHQLIQWSGESQLLQGLSVFEKIRYYALAVLGAPRRLLSLLRSDSNTAPDHDFVVMRGARMRQLGWPETEFHTVNVPPKVIPESELIRSQVVGDDFRLENSDSPFQLLTLRKIQNLVHSRGSHLAFINMPLYHERRDKKILIKIPLGDLVSESTPFIGVPNAKLFSQLSDPQVQELFYNANHMNENGMKFFTKTIYPAIAKTFTKDDSSHE